MTISIIGTGNVAFVLGRLIRRSGHEILQVIGRNVVEGNRLAIECGASFSPGLANPDSRAAIIIAALSDNALYELAGQIKAPHCMLVHTAGSVPLEVFKNASHNFGVLYPLQSLRKESTHIPEIPFLIDANTADNSSLLEDFAKSLSDKVQLAGDDKRLRLHTAAVFVNNFSNHLFALAEAFCKSEKIDFNLLHPLIIETAEKVKDLPPSSAQTGPATRNDESSIKQHLKLLEDYPRLREVYALMTASIQDKVLTEGNGKV